MKKEYKSPIVELEPAEGESALLSVSSRQWEIGYGGIDTDGSKEPDAHELEFDEY